MKKRRTIYFDIHEMLRLRTTGISYANLARKFHRDPSTILYHCVVFGVQPGGQVPTSAVNEAFEVFLGEHPRVDLRSHNFSYDPREGKINKGKSYKEYLADALKRPDEAAYYKTYHQTALTSMINKKLGEGAPMEADDFYPDP